MNSLRYRPELDGLRAFAVLPVILFHLKFGWIPGGFIGVDVFFVISGFLITSIILQEHEAKTFSFRTFWARRIRRIVPPLLFMIVSVLAVSFCLQFKGDRFQTGKESLAALLSSANIYFWRFAGSYWGSKAEESPLLHTWSLSVEEQFYLLYPLAVWAILRSKPDWLKRAVLVVILTSLGLFLAGSIRYPTATFYLLPTRAWELASGCYLAIVLKRRQGTPSARISLELLGLVGLCAVLASYFLVSTLGVGIVIPVLGTALIIAFAGTGPAFVILTRPIVVYLGKISYSLYLWHWPVFLYRDVVAPGWNNWALFGVILILAMASYHLIEAPTRRMPSVVPAIGACYALTLALAVALIMSNDLYDTSNFEQPVSYQFYYSLTPHRDPDDNRRHLFATTLTPSSTAASDAYRTSGILVGKGNADPRIVVLGDSHGAMWADPIKSVSEKLAIKTSIYVMGGVKPFINLPLSKHQHIQFMSSDEKYEYDKARLDAIHKWKPSIVIICASWWWNDSASEMRGLLDYLQSYGVQVLLMEQPPVLAIGDRNALQYLCYKNIRPEIGVKQYLPMREVDSNEKYRSFIRSLAKHYHNCHIIPTFDLYSHGTDVLVLDGKHVVYLDDDHLTAYGAQLAVHRIEKSVNDILNSIPKTDER